MKTLKMLLPALVLGMALLLQAGEALAARQITLQNSSSRKICVALALPSSKGWWVTAWYNVQPWSTRRVNINWAGGNNFGYYAFVPGQNIFWQGKGNAPTVSLTKASQSHAANRWLEGSTRHKMIMKNGSGVKFTWVGDQRGDRGDTTRHGGGWW